MKIILVLILAVILFAIFSFTQAKKALKPRRKDLDLHPKDLGLNADEISFITRDEVELKGWFIKSENSFKTIIFMHGWGMNKADILKYTSFLHGENYNLFYFDFRAQGGSGGERGGIGMLEGTDIEAAIDYVKNVYPEQSVDIALYGISMGAAAAAYRASVDREVKCVVLEAMYYSFKQVVTLWAWTHKRVPYYPFVPALLFFMKRIMGVEFEDLSPKTTSAKITAPVLMIHGEFDDLAPLNKAKEIFELISAPKEMWVVPGALHNNCAEAAGDEYKARLKKFLKQNF